MDPMATGLYSRRPKRKLWLTTTAAKVEQPPQEKKKKKKRNATTSSDPSLSSLPDDIILNCLARISKSQYRSLSLVSKSIRSLVSSPELYPARSHVGNTEPCLYLCQQLPTYDRWYILDRTLTTNDGLIMGESNLSPITPPSSPAPSMSTTVAVGFEIYQMGGTMNAEPSSAVRVLDCRTQTWRDAPNMTVARTRAESAFIDGKILVIGGTEELQSWAEVFDLKTQTWKPFSCPFGKFFLYQGSPYVKSGHTNYVYISKQGRWEQSLEPEVGLGISGPWCIIGKVKFSFRSHKLRWYDSYRRIWLDVEGLEDLYIHRPWVIWLGKLSTVRLANHGGKLIIIWDKPRYLKFPVAGKKREYVCKNKIFWCAVVRLEKRIGFSGSEIWGEIEHLNALLTVPKSYQFLSCITL